MIEFGTYHFGCKTRKQWPNKPYLYWGRTYHDGKHWVVHLGPFYFGRSFY